VTVIADIDYSKLPENVRYPVRAYIESGREPGDFLTAVICNDLHHALSFADHDNLAKLKTIVQFFYTQAPTFCWGDAKKFAFWTDRGGLHGHLPMPDFDLIAEEA
jgi:hypothetical protein